MRGMDPPPLVSHLFPFQRECVEFGLRAGSWGLFLDTGLGKTARELEWCQHAASASNGRALILTPLAVARQIEAEGRRWGYTIRVIREQDGAGDGINVCNYDRLDRLDVAAFGAVALDESSILKAFSGKTTRALIQAFASHRWRMAATATPAPNDHMELGNHSDFLGIMPQSEMLVRWFINDSGDASKTWRLKGHAVEAFWGWMASWCRMAEHPRDLGDDVPGFDLPPLRVHRHHVEAGIVGTGLFGADIVSAAGMHALKRQTADVRAGVVADLVASDSEPWIVWCDTDYEADALGAVLPDAREVRGSHPVERKERDLSAFADGTARVLITKPAICGFGLNWQHCARVAFVGRSFSYESWYQAVRRCWRFGQTRPVDVHVVVAEGEDSIGRVIDRKADDHKTMKAAMVAAMRRAIGSDRLARVPYRPSHEGRLPSWL
jgi:hypothetical protein